MFNKGQWSRTVINFRKWVRPVYLFCTVRRAAAESARPTCSLANGIPVFFHPHQCRRHILAIIEAMLQVRLQQDVVELLRQVYVAYGNCFSEKSGNLLVLETCDTASDTCDEKLHV